MDGAGKRHPRAATIGLPAAEVSPCPADASGSHSRLKADSEQKTAHRRYGAALAFRHVRGFS